MCVFGIFVFCSSMEAPKMYTTEEIELKAQKAHAEAYRCLAAAQHASAAAQDAYALYYVALQEAKESRDFFEQVERSTLEHDLRVAIASYCEITNKRKESPK